MTAKWKTFDRDPAEATLDAMLHWLVVPTPQDGDSQSFQNLIVSYVFRFANNGDFQQFQNRFTDNPKVFFPKLSSLRLPRSEAVVAVGFSRLGNLPEIYEFLSGTDSGEVFLTGLPIESFAEVAPNDALIDLSGADNVIAIIDTDIGFANARFRDGVTSTRIAGFWDQDASSGPALPLVLGKAIDQPTINTYLQQFEQDGNVDEPALYAQYFQDCYLPGEYPRLPTRIGHGTHILDVIDGAELDAVGGGNLPILAVNLRKRAVDATHGLFLLPWVILGILWITGLTAPKRAQVNFSFGGIAGRHDGFGPLEMVLDWILDTDQATAISVPAGNFYGTDTHASFLGADLTEPKTLEWNIQPNDGTSNMVEIWLPECSPKDPQLRVTLTAPNGVTETFTDADIGMFHELIGADGKIWARVYIDCMSLFGAPPRVRMAIFVRHTAIERDYFQFLGGVPGLAGRWTLELEALSLEEEERVELWVERDDALGLARNGARQSYFEAPRPVWPEPAPPSFVRNDGTTSDIATGQKTLVAAGSVRASRQPPSYSSEGFGRDNCNGNPPAPVRFPPTAAATCDDSRAHGGILASGFFSSSTVAMNGTSAASGMVARKVKEELLAGNGVTRPDIQALAASEDGRPIPPTACINTLFGTYDPVPPETRIGAGCLDQPWTRLPRIIL